MMRRSALVLITWLLASPLHAGEDGGFFDHGFESPPPEPPAFEGILLAYSPAPGEVTLEWLPATDESTLPEAIEYEVYMGSASLADDISGGQPPEVVLVGQEAHTFTALTPDVEVWFAVIAVDQDGLPSPGIYVVSVTPSVEPLVMGAELKVLADLGISAQQTGFDEFTLSGPGATGILVGDYVLIENTFGRTLREVVTVNIDGALNHITTFKASLSDLIESGDLRVHANVVLDNSAGEGARTPTQQVSLLESTRTTPRIRRAQSSDGRLTMESRDFGRAPVAREDSAVRGDTSLADGIDLQYTVQASLKMATDVRWNESFVDTPEYMKGVLTGSFSVDALASYTLAGAANYETEQELLNKTFTFLYTVGGLPVHQEVTVKLMAGLEFSSEAAFNMALTGHAQKDITLGFEWSDAAGFSLIREDGFENVISFDLSGKAAAKGSLKIYPVISTRMYKAAQVALFLVPEFTLDAEARLLPPPVEINKFDLDFWVKGFVEADLTIFGQELARWDSDKAQLLHVPIFSQPEITLRHSTAQLDTCGTRKLFLGVTDGYNNAVPSGNISWSVDPPAGTNLVISPSGAVAEFSTENPGDYTIEVSAYGNGFLGVLGTRYAFTDINVIESKDDPCDPDDVDVTASDVISCVPLDMGLWDSITPSKNTVVPGESLDFNIPMYCENGCGVKAWFGATGVKDTPTEQTAIHYLISGGGTYGDLFIPPPDSQLGQFELQIASVDFPPGVYSAAIEFHYETPTVINGSYYSDPYNNLGANPSARPLHPLSYELQAQYWPDFPNVKTKETCIGADTGIPVMPVRVVAGGLDNDEDDVPEDSHEVGVNAPPVRAWFDDNEDDWFDFDFSPGDYEGGVYDADAPFDVKCPIEVEVLTEQDFTHYVTLFPDLESANNLTGALISGQHFSYQPMPGVQYYLLAQSDHPFPGSFDYQIDVREQCEPPTSPYPMLTSTPQLSTMSPTPGQGVDITIDFTTDTDRARASWRNLETDAEVSCFGQNTGLLGMTTTTLNCSAPVAAGEWIVQIALYPENCCHQSYFVKDDLFSETHYTLRGENFPEVLRMYTDIEFATASVVPP